MKKALTILLLTTSFAANAYIDTWQKVNTVPSSSHQVIHPDKYLVFSLQVRELKTMLFSLSESPEAGRVISFPAPDGSMKQFKVWQAPMLEPGLDTKFPDIKTFTAVAIDDKSITAKFDFTLLGFHAMVFDGEKTYYINPYSNPADNYYLCYYKHDISLPANIDKHCAVADNKDLNEIQHDAPMQMGKDIPALQLKQNGTNRYTYRLAIACTGEYSVAVAGTATPSKAISLSAITTSINRVNGVFEREIGVHLNIIANDTAIIYLDGSTDPYTNGNGYAMQSENQSNLTAVINPLNYDMGHVLATGTTGVAQLGSVCVPTTKAMGVTGQPMPTGAAFDIDFIAHEMGHQLGATHTFNANTINCGGNGVNTSAYEPGSGSSIMGYAGICGSNNNLQAHSDDYFHAKSLDQIGDFVTTSTSLCATITPSNNIPPGLPSITQVYDIPYLTPFELTSPAAVDADHDILTYNWEEWDLGDFGASFADVKANGAIFRSFNPSTSATRIFPTLDKLRANITNYLGEKLPEVTRTLRFKVTVRDMLGGYGAYNISDDTVRLNVTSSSGPFKVNFPNVITDYMQSGSTSTVTWNVANTTAGPVNCSNVNIFLSTDDGFTFPYTLATNTPNDGSETINVPPSIYSAGCRVKVKGAGNVFFDMSDHAFSVFPWPADVSAIEKADDNFSIYPVPAKEMLNIDAKVAGNYDIVIANTLGQQVWNGSFEKQMTVNIGGWAAGVYNIKFTNTQNNVTFVKKVVVE